MEFRILFDGTVAKHTEQPYDNEDAYRIDQERGRVVLSDGASESFDAKNWANLLVDACIDTEPLDEALFACIQKYNLQYDPSTLSWSKVAAYERGSFATMLIVQDDPIHKNVSVSAMGDSLAVWSDGNNLLDTTPYSCADQFTQKPMLLATRNELNPSLSDTSSVFLTQKMWSYEDNKTHFLLCMTDALGAWLLHHQEHGDKSALERLISIRSQQELQYLVETERTSGKLRRDDTTLIIISLTCEV
ncbi:hypothetical protein NMR92_000923 [Vibrio cholerae]|uniref:hypothetical protein n=1 Tax=Vibrio TaxID=662 RepID=UPI00053C7F45|nr:MULTISPECIES: hypothetical protein [Vibrio]EGR0011295.1 hypothetical protein [Vibrio cholerae]EGR0892194.1 hypothetical protein [Vibrio cholerae]EGR4205455.1 hypothetical protein [Vibrio cholerae]EGR4210356.1 hypothetical protein [Vibrio cholerae]EJL6490025.1 hypothetical protein [Vibrio cholerae]